MSVVDQHYIIRIKHPEKQSKNDSNNDSCAQSNKQRNHTIDDCDQALIDLNQIRISTIDQSGIESTAKPLIDFPVSQIVQYLISALIASLKVPFSQSNNPIHDGVLIDGDELVIDYKKLSAPSSVNQTSNQTNNQSTGQSVDQTSVFRLVKQSHDPTEPFANQTNNSVKHDSVIHPITESISQSNRQSSRQSEHQSTHLLNLSPLPITQFMHRSISQDITSFEDDLSIPFRSLNQSINQSMNSPNMFRSVSIDRAINQSINSTDMFRSVSIDRTMNRGFAFECRMCGQDSDMAWLCSKCDQSINQPGQSPEPVTQTAPQLNNQSNNQSINPVDQINPTRKRQSPDQSTQPPHSDQPNKKIARSIDQTIAQPIKQSVEDKPVIHAPDQSIKQSNYASADHHLMQDDESFDRSIDYDDDQMHIGTLPNALRSNYQPNNQSNNQSVDQEDLPLLPANIPIHHARRSSVSSSIDQSDDPPTKPTNKRSSTRRSSKQSAKKSNDQSIKQSRRKSVKSSADLPPGEVAAERYHQFIHNQLPLVESLNQASNHTSNREFFNQADQLDGELSILAASYPRAFLNVDIESSFFRPMQKVHALFSGAWYNGIILAIAHSDEILWDMQDDDDFNRLVSRSRMHPMPGIGITAKQFELITQLPSYQRYCYCVRWTDKRLNCDSLWIVEPAIRNGWRLRSGKMVDEEFLRIVNGESPSVDALNGIKPAGWNEDLPFPPTVRKPIDLWEMDEEEQKQYLATHPASNVLPSVASTDQTVASVAPLNDQSVNQPIHPSNNPLPEELLSSISADQIASSALALSIDQSIDQPGNPSFTLPLKDLPSTEQLIESSLVSTDDSAVDQPGNPLIDQTVTQPLTPSVVQTTKQSNDLSNNQSNNQSISQTNKQSNNALPAAISNSSEQADDSSFVPSSDQTINQTMNLSINQTNSEPTSLLNIQATSQSVNQTINQSAAIQLLTKVRSYQQAYGEPSTQSTGGIEITTSG